MNAPEVRGKHDRRPACSNPETKDLKVILTRITESLTALSQYARLMTLLFCEPDVDDEGDDENDLHGKDGMYADRAPRVCSGVCPFGG